MTLKYMASFMDLQLCKQYATAILKGNLVFAIVTRGVSYVQGLTHTELCGKGDHWTLHCP